MSKIVLREGTGQAAEVGNVLDRVEVLQVNIDRAHRLGKCN